MTLSGKTLVLGTALVCVAALAVSVYPGWLGYLLFVGTLYGIVWAPFVLVVLGAGVFMLLLRGVIQVARIERKQVGVTIVLLMTTYLALRYYIPRRIAFEWCRSSFQQIVDGGVNSDHDFDRGIGLYHVDECLVDDRGGTYFRVFSNADGIGPDLVSYGFCYKPNSEGSPFGAADYRTFRLGNDWYWFLVSDDWF